MNQVKLFEEQQVRAIWNEEEQQWYFSVVDVCNILAETIDARKYWNKLKQRLKAEGSELVTKCHQLKMTASDGKLYKTDALNTDGILRLIQSIPSKKAEPFKLWLARVGRERLEEIANPELAIARMHDTYLKKGYSEEWINTRLKSIDIRKQLTNEWKNRGVDDSKDYAILTAEISKGTFGMTPAEYKKYKRLDNPHDNPRDHMTDTELLFTMLGEITAKNNSIEMDAQGFNENKYAAKKAGSAAGAALKAFEEESGQQVASTTNFKIETESQQRKSLKNKTENRQ